MNIMNQAFPAALAVLVALTPCARGEGDELELDDIGDIGDIELNEGEKLAAEMAKRKATPPLVVASWNFDKESPDSKGLPRGWWTGIWGERKVLYGTEEGYGGKGRSMKVDVRTIAGGDLQIFSSGWALMKGGWYKISFKMRGFDHPGNVMVQVRQVPYPWTSPLGGVSIRPTDEWKEYSFGGKSGVTMKSGEFGILVSTGSAGSFAIDDIKVEQYLENPFPPPETLPPVPFTAGNLVPRGSFESAEEPFWSNDHISGDPHHIFNEPRIARAEGGHDGAHCLRYAGQRLEDGQLTGGSRLVSLPIPVATGRVYRMSAWMRTSAPSVPVSISVSAGNETLAGQTLTLSAADGWKHVTCATKAVPASVRSVLLNISPGTGEEVFIDSVSFGADAERRGGAKFEPAAPYELDVGFVRKDPFEPRIVEWGQSLPLTVGAWPAAGAEAGRKIPAKIRVTAYPNTVTCERSVTLTAGRADRIDLDPKANGVLRVELIPDDPALARPLELVMGRLPKPRATGAKGRFGTHMRVTPQILAFGRAIGLTWQRLHDCSGICKMSWGNPAPGKYRWADREVDALRAYGFSILGLPDAPPDWVMKTEYVEKAKAKKARLQKEEELDLSPEDMSDSDDLLFKEMAERRKEVDRKLNSDEVTVYDTEAFKTWCREVAKHYRGRIEHFEIWNEPYMPYFYHGTDFGAIFNAGAKGIREGNPGAKVLGWCNEFTTPHFVSPFLKKYPVKDKPDLNTMHYYFSSPPGDGEQGIEIVVAKYPKTLGEYQGAELWDSEGNMAGNSSFYSSRFHADGAASAAAFGVRGWSETFFGGVARLFIYCMFNSDGPLRNGGLMNTIDYDRSLNVWGAATATTAYFIDAMDPVTSIASPEGVKLRVFTGCGRSSAVLFDDCLVRGRLKFDAAKLPEGWLVTDAMGNDLRGRGPLELGRIPYLVLAEGVSAEKIAAGICIALGER